MYIIENASILKDKQLSNTSLLIAEDRITKIQSCFNRYRLIRMNVESFIMTPSYIFLNSNIPQDRPFLEWKQWMINQILLKGCTTLLTYVEVSYERELTQRMKEMEGSLMSSPIDYSVGVKIPVRFITPSFIRKCKNDRIPAIFVEIDDVNDLEVIPWGWIREALFPFNSPLIPIISSGSKKEGKVVLSKWKEIIKKEKIPAIEDELIENQPLPIVVLNKLGLYPQKSSFMSNTELSYNLYLKTREIKNVDEVSLFHYYGDRLVVTVHKGKIVRSGKEVLFRPGNGEHVKVRTPSYFSM